jgi:hypothetical protein
MERLLLGVQRTRSGRSDMSALDPLQKWGRGERYPMPSIGSNMNVINISAKKSELDLAR